MTSRVIVRIGERELAVAVEADGRSTVDGVPVRVERAGADCWRVEGPTGSRLVYLAGPAGDLWCAAGGDVVQPEVLVPGRAPRPRRGSFEGTLAAPMPATVRKVHVEPGQAVRRGDTVITLEAMKMELPLRAPGDGTVQVVRCREGELVQPGLPLVEIG